MKKVLSVILAVIMAFGVCSVSFAAMANTNVISPGDRDDIVDVIVQINGKDSMDVEFERDETNPNKITLIYNGNGNLVKWEFEPAVDGTKIEIVTRTEDSITIIVNDGSIEQIVANAIVTGDDGTGKGDGDTTSPSTGAVAATGLVAAGAGVAILAVLKKKNDAE